MERAFFTFLAYFNELRLNVFRNASISSTYPGTSVRHTFGVPFCQRLTWRCTWWPTWRPEKEKNMADMELDMVADKKTIENTRLVCLLLLYELNFLLLIN